MLRDSWLTDPQGGAPARVVGSFPRPQAASGSACLLVERLRLVPGRVGWRAARASAGPPQNGLIEVARGESQPERDWLACSLDGARLLLVAGGGRAAWTAKALAVAACRVELTRRSRTRRSANPGSSRQAGEGSLYLKCDLARDVLASS